MATLAGCGDGAGAVPPDLALPPPGADMGFAAAPHPLPPQMPNGGGPVLAHPSIVTITWPGDALAAALVSFDGWMAGSAYLTDSLGQYGIGAGAAAATFSAPAAAPAMMTDDDLRKLLTDGVAAGTLPAPSVDRLYVLYTPDGTTVDSGVGLSCDAFSGYHNFIATAGGAPIVYAIVARCPALAGLSVLQSTTVTASHEIAEAVTDPLGTTWTIRTPDPVAPFGGEVGDLCDGRLPPSRATR